MLKRFNNEDSCRVSDVVTGEETWIYQFDLEMPVIGLGLSRWATPNQSQEAKECWEENGGHFLLNEWSPGNCCARGSEDSYSKMVYRSLAPPSILRNSGEAAKDRTARNSAPPWQCLFPHSHCNNCISGKGAGEIDSSSLQSRPGPVRHFPVPEREESRVRTQISQPRRRCCCLQWRAKCNVWERAAWVLPEVVPEGAAVYRMCSRVLWKDVIGNETLSLSIVAYLKTYLVTLGSRYCQSDILGTL